MVTGLTARRLILAGTILVVLGAAGFGGAAFAQPMKRDVTPLNLPRRGFEYDGFRLGAATVLAEVDASAEYDSNVFATSQDEIDDVRFELAPSISVRSAPGGTVLRADAYGVFRRYANQVRENSEEFGASARFDLTSKDGQAFTANAEFDRAIEARGDPESRVGPTDRPRKIDIYKGELSYRHRFGSITAVAAGAAERFNILDPAEADRDMSSYRASLRLAYRAASSLDVFVEGYVNRRDFRLAQDFSGVDRDATTLGVYVGVQRELGQRLRGRIGVGWFRANPEDATLDGFTGLGANGEIVWFPRTRTAVSLRFSRGDVATVRSGAIGRIDTSVKLSVNQEIRHNLLARVSAAYLDREFRGSSRGHLKSVGVDGEVEFLIDRHTSIWAGLSYSDRNAIRDIDRFDRFAASIGIRHKI